MKLRTVILSALVATSSLASIPAFAETPGAHPAYLHAMSDLRTARWLVSHQGGGWKRTTDEVDAVAQIDAALHDLKKAAIDDGKNGNAKPQFDPYTDDRGRLHQAADLLARARQDISQEEDNGWATGLRDRSYRHIDSALEHVRHAIHE